MGIVSRRTLLLGALGTIGLPAIAGCAPFPLVHEVSSTHVPSSPTSVSSSPYETEALISALAWSPDGKRLATLLEQYAGVQVWDLTNNARHLTLGTFHSTTGKGAWNFAWSADGQQIATAASAKETRIWDARSGNLLHEYHIASCWAVDWSRDGKRLAIGGIGDEQISSLHTLDPLTGGSVVAYQNDQQANLTSEGKILCLKWSPNGKYIATDGYLFLSQSANGTLQLLPQLLVWEVATGRLVTVRDHPDYATGMLDWSPDSRYIASLGPASGNKTSIEVWEVATSKQVTVYQTGFPGSIAWSPDGKYIASSGGAIIDIWEPLTGKLHFRSTEYETQFPTFESSVYVAWSPDGKRLAAAGPAPSSSTGFRSVVHFLEL